MIKFVFDLDGTVTRQEALPIIANHFGVSEDINALTRETIIGNIPFVESFIKRVHILSKLPVDKVSKVLGGIKFYEDVVQFIQSHSDNCAIATGNLDCWVNALLDKINCTFHTSTALVENNQIVKLTKILKKESVVNLYRQMGDQVVYIGEGNNDAEGMRLADISIASGLTHAPSKSVMSITDYVVYSEESLCRLLNQLY